MLDRNTTPREVADAAERFVSAFRHGTEGSAYLCFRDLKDYMDAVYWPNPLHPTDSSDG